MPTPRRYSNGVTNVSSSDPFAQLGMLDPTRYHVLMDDFRYFDPEKWIARRSESWTGNSALATEYLDSYEEITDARDGILAIVTTPTDNNYTFFQSGHLWTRHSSASGNGETFALASGKKVWFKSRLKADDVDTCSLKVGLVVADSTDPIETANSDGLWFQSDDGDANLDFHIYTSSSSTVSDTAITTISDDTYFTVSFYFDGSSYIYYYVNGNLEGSTSTSSYPTGELCASFGIMNGSAASSTLSVDYICVIEER